MGLFNPANYNMQQYDEPQINRDYGFRSVMRSLFPVTTFIDFITICIPVHQFSFEKRVTLKMRQTAAQSYRFKYASLQMGITVQKSKQEVITKKKKKKKQGRGTALERSVEWIGSGGLNTVYLLDPSPLIIEQLQIANRC